jgi:hypothetical protein
VDLGYSWYWLASGTDRYFRPNGGLSTSRDYTENFGKHIGNEADIRARYAPTRNTEIVLGYSFFKAGAYTEGNIWTLNPGNNGTPGKGDSNFAYLEISQKFF